MRAILLSAGKGKRLRPLTKKIPKCLVKIKKKTLIDIWLNDLISKNKVEKVLVNKMKLGDPDDGGRRKPIIDEGSEYEIETDIVIKSLGFDPEDLPKLFGEKDLQVSKWGTIKIDFDTMETNLKGVFAAGDIVRGASLVVWAIKDGRDVAESIDKLLKSKREQDLKVA